MNQAVSSTNLRKDIINLLMKIDDVKKLEHIFVQIGEIEEMEMIEDKQSPDIEEGLVEIIDDVTLWQLLQEQGYKPIDYQNFKSLTDAIDWEHSLDELLENLD